MNEILQNLFCYSIKWKLFLIGIDIGTMKNLFMSVPKGWHYLDSSYKKKKRFMSCCYVKTKPNQMKQTIGEISLKNL